MDFSLGVFFCSTTLVLTEEVLQGFERPQNHAKPLTIGRRGVKVHTTNISLLILPPWKNYVLSPALAVGDLHLESHL